MLQRWFQVACLRQLACLLAMCWVAAGPAWAAVRTVTVFNTYQGPPFVINESAGIAPALLRFLNTQLHGKYRFELFNLPRERLRLAYLTRGRAFDGVVMLLAPPFVDDPEMTRFLWTRPLFEDYNVLVFRRGEMAAIKTLAELKGKTFAQVLGHRYGKLDAMVASGELQVEVSSSELSNLHMVALRRADFTQMNSLFFLYLRARPELQSADFSALPEPESPAFQRRILVGKGNPELFRLIDAALVQLPCDAGWQKAQKDIGFNAIGCKEARKPGRP